MQAHKHPHHDGAVSPSSAIWFWWRNIPHPMSLFARGWKRPPSKGFIRINKIKENIIYFFSLCVNYNNRSPAVGNDSLNGIHCRRQSIIIYKVTKDIVVTYNIVAQLYFQLTLKWSFNYIYAWQNINDRKTCTYFAGHFDGRGLTAIGAHEQCRLFNELHCSLVTAPIFVRY